MTFEINYGHEAITAPSALAINHMEYASTDSGFIIPRKMARVLFVFHNVSTANEQTLVLPSLADTNSLAIGGLFSPLPFLESEIVQLDKFVTTGVNTAMDALDKSLPAGYLIHNTSFEHLPNEELHDDTIDAIHQLQDQLADALELRYNIWPEELTEKD